MHGLVLTWRDVSLQWMAEPFGETSILEADISLLVVRSEGPVAMNGLLTDSVRVLIVDDEADNAKSLAALLRLGYQCETKTCTEGAACLEVVREFRPHLLLVDVHMPVMGGFEIARALRDANLMPPLVIALSGSGGLTAVEDSLDAGCHAHELKPMSSARMKELVAQARELTGSFA